MTAVHTERSCGDCTMCCKVYAIPVMNKPRGIWCQECMPGKGCKIWSARPQFCRDFQCKYIVDPRLDESWRPNICKFVMSQADAQTLNITVDAGQPLAYRKEPYFTALKKAAGDLMTHNGSIVIFSGESQYLLLPDGEHLLGPRGVQFNWSVKARIENGQKAYSVIAEQKQ